jgi:hypothetical protein
VEEPDQPYGFIPTKKGVLTVRRLNLAWSLDTSKEDGI